MEATIEKAVDIEELLRFLSEQNQHKQSHIGYCGEKAEEIYQALVEDFVNESGEISFVVARNDSGEIIAAIGVDIDGTSAEVWGPFNKNASVDLQYRLWKQLVKEYPTIQTYNFFINQENKMQQLFMKELKASKTGEHLTLKINRRNFHIVSKLHSVSFSQSDFQAFEKIHNDAFPNTYYDAKTIIARLSNHHILKVLKNENELQGYAYYEMNMEMEEASLEYIAIAPKAQNKGLGTMLLKEVLTEIFSYPQMNVITLCVNHENKQANRVYMKAGFEPLDILISYQLTNQRGEEYDRD